MNFTPSAVTDQVLRAIKTYGPISIIRLDQLHNLAPMLPASGSRAFVKSLMDQKLITRANLSCERDATEYEVSDKGRRALTAADREAKGTIAGPRSYAPVGTYVPLELRPFTGRAGAMDAFTHPSLVNSAPVDRVRPLLIGAGPQPKL